MKIHQPGGKPPIEYATTATPPQHFVSEITGKPIDVDLLLERIKRADFNTPVPIERQRAPRPRVERSRYVQPRRTRCGKNLHDMVGDNVMTSITNGRIKRTCRPCRHIAEAERRKVAALKRPPKPPRTHCGNGHALTPENTYLHPTDGPRCRACRTAMRVEWAQRKGEKAIVEAA